MTQPIAPVLAPEPIVQSVRPPPTSGAAIAALVFAITGLIGPLVLVGPLLALAFARKARREMERSGWALGGWEVARAARIIAWTALVFLILAAIALAALASLSDYYDPGNDLSDLFR